MWKRLGPQHTRRQWNHYRIDRWEVLSHWVSGLDKENRIKISYFRHCYDKREKDIHYTSSSQRHLSIMARRTWCTSQFTAWRLESRGWETGTRHSQWSATSDLLPQVSRTFQNRTTSWGPNIQNTTLWETVHIHIIGFHVFCLSYPCEQLYSAHSVFLPWKATLAQA